MTEILEYLTRYGYLLIFIFVFLEGMGLPLPAAPILLAAGAMSAVGLLEVLWVVAIALVAMLTGDGLMYLLGRHTGWSILALLCKISLNPESCMVRSAEAFYRKGRLTLLFSKFLPGISTMAPPLAGSLRMNVKQFLWLDLLASLLYIVPFTGLGFIFSKELSRLTRGLASVNRAVGWLFVGALIIYLANRIRVMWKDRLYHGVPRVDVHHLRQRLDEDHDKILVADVRSHGYYDPGTMRIKNSIRLEPANVTERFDNLPRDKVIYLYCT